MPKVTLKVIANQLGLSTSTVSRALKDYSDINIETKRKVQELAKSLNYTPNSFAVSLRMKESKTIGVIIPTMVHFFFSNVIDGILKEAEKCNYMTFLMQSNENDELEEKQVDLLLSKGVDGIIISLTNQTRNFKHLQKIIDSNVPLILFDKIVKIINCSKVLIDDRKAAYEAVSHLINKGYKRIAHFRGQLNPQNSIDRFLGYKKALQDHNIEFDPTLVYLCNNNSDFEDGYESAKKLIQDHGNNVDALFTVNDLLAIGALNYFNNHQIKVPERIGLMGFSNWFMTKITSPSISTIDQNAILMGEEAAKILLKEIKLKQKGIPYEYEKIIIDTELIIRNSC